MNTITKLCSMLYLMTMNCNSLPNNYCGLTVNIYGTGICVKHDVVKDGFNITTLVENFEFVTKEVLKKRKFIFVNKALAEIEMPLI